LLDLNNHRFSNTELIWRR